MAYNQQQGGYNPYGGGGNPYQASNPYGSNGGAPHQDYQGYSGPNPYASNAAGHLQQPPISHQASNVSQGSNYSQPGANPAPGIGYSAAMPLDPRGPTVLSSQDFLSRVEGTRRDIDQLSQNISQIATLHQRSVTSTDSSSNAQLDNMTTQTQILNTKIRDQIKFLETDAARSGGAATKDSQIRNLKNTFKQRLEQYQEEERTYRKRYQEQIARQYRIVNPAATEDEVREASTANWGDEGVFQTALKSNRTGAATSVLGTVRARHAEIQQIEKTLLELNQLFQDLAETVILQEAAVTNAEEQTTNVVKDTEQANVQLGKGVEHARRARRLKWICLGICVLVVVVLGLALGIYFGVTVPNQNRNRQKRDLEALVRLLMQ